MFVVMVTVLPLGISIVFPSLVLAVKRLTTEAARPQSYNIFYAAMILGAVFGGPIVDIIRHDFKQVSFTYTHTNGETGKEEAREQEFSAWRTVCFFGFALNLLMILLLSFYDSEVEQRFLQ